LQKFVNRYSDIMSCITLDVEEGPIRRTIMTLEPSATSEDVESISKLLDRRGFRVIQVENLREKD
jgi:hypothetical protein